MIKRFLRWLGSRTIRQAVDLRRQVIKYLNAQRDLLSPNSIEGLENGVGEMNAVLADPANGKKEITEAMTRLEKTANQHLKPYPHAGTRENVEVILVAVALALGVRTFYLQPFKIPTGSMQPTLYGITHEDLRDRPETEIPGRWDRFVAKWVRGETYYHVQAKAPGRLEEIEKPKRLLLFFEKQRFRVGSEWYTIWSPPEKFMERTGLITDFGYSDGREFETGEDLIRLKVTSGDHLFVDRLTYNWRPPQRGEIIVFKTEGIPTLPNDLFYIKRCVGLPGEKIRIGDDQHAIIDGDRLDAATPRFESVYTFETNYVEGKDQYFGHANGLAASRAMHRDATHLAPNFLDQRAVFQIRPDHYFALGDNTLHSLDGRAWGDLPEENVIGKSFFVYWPITRRFGWSHR